MSRAPTTRRAASSIPAYGRPRAISRCGRPCRTPEPRLKAGPYQKLLATWPPGSVTVMPNSLTPLSDWTGPRPLAIGPLQVAPAMLRQTPPASSTASNAVGKPSPNQVGRAGQGEELPVPAVVAAAGDRAGITHHHPRVDLFVVVVPGIRVVVTVGGAAQPRGGAEIDA